MKSHKTAIVDALIQRAADERIVSLRDVARSLGVDHMGRQDAMEVVRAALAQLPDYHPVRIESTPKDSLFCSVCLVENCVEFTDADGEVE